MHVDEALARAGRLDERVATGCRLAQPGAGDKEQVGLTDPPRQSRVDGDTGPPGVYRRVVVDVGLTAERRYGGQAAGLREGEHVARRLLRPPTAADEQERALGRGEQLGHVLELVTAGMRLNDPVRLGIGNLGRLGEHILRERKHDRAGPPRARDVVRPADELRDPLLLGDLANPLGQRREHRLEVDFLEGLATEMPARHLAHDQHHGRRVLARRVHADAGVSRAGTAGDEANARPSGQLSVGLGHVRGAGLHPAGDEA